MVKIATLNKISPAGLNRFPKDHFEITEQLDEANGILVRSQKMLDMDFSDQLYAIGRAGVGFNNIPIDRCAEEGIVVFNTPGANANGVKELVIGGMLLAIRHILPATDWASSLEDDGDLTVEKKTEKGKSQFKGSELMGKTIGVVGLGGIGGMVANVCVDLGMTVYGYDPFISTHNAHRLYREVQLVQNMNDMLPFCDFLTVHLHANADTNGMIDTSVLSALKTGAILLNYSRATIVDFDSVKSALESGKISAYVTDFPTAKVLTLPHTIVTPHLGASTDEAEDNCAIMAANELIDYFENGNIVNSVNYPRITLGARRDQTRLSFLTTGIDSPVDTIINALKYSPDDIHINQVNGGTRGDFGYVLISTDSDVSKLPEIDGVIRSRIIH